MHRHNTPLRGVRAVPRPQPDNPEYTAVNYAYAGKEGHIHEVVEIGGRELAKVGFNDRKIVYYFLQDLELDHSAKRGTFHDEPAP
jgi:ribosomal protein S6